MWRQGGEDQAVDFRFAVGTSHDFSSGGFQYFRGPIVVEILPGIVFALRVTLPPPLHTHTFHELFWVIAGTGIHVINGENRPTVPGLFIIGVLLARTGAASVTP